MIFGPGLTIGGEFTKFVDIFEARFPQRRFCFSGEVVRGVNDVGGGVHFFLKEGSVSSRLVHESGNKVNLATRSKGSIFPLYFSKRKTSVELDVENIALEDCNLIIIPNHELRELMLEIPEIGLAMVDAYSQFSTFLDYSLTSALYDSLFVRVCNTLYLHSENVSEIVITHDQLAEAIGASRANVSRALREAQEYGVIKVNRGKIIITDRKKLLDLCSYIVKS